MIVSKINLDTIELRTKYLYKSLLIGHFIIFFIENHHYHSYWQTIPPMVST